MGMDDIDRTAKKIEMQENIDEAEDWLNYELASPHEQGEGK